MELYCSIHDYVFDPDSRATTRKDKAGLGCSAIVGPLAIQLGRLDRAIKLSR
jgi:hypothetical protein